MMSGRLGCRRRNLSSAVPPVVYCKRERACTTCMSRNGTARSAPPSFAHETKPLAPLHMPAPEIKQSIVSTTKNDTPSLCMP